ncbi:MAG: class I mannose-6-phosphate isomerase [Clostridia bacterium]|nr:class I mannose-6-phosphate isomerase [Clostridia bacterium]
MQPLLLTPALKDYLWGGQRLPQEYGYATDLDRVAEAWVLSCHPQGESLAATEPYKGQPLSQILAAWGPEALGTRCNGFDRFPMLIKFIDARDRLSVQVHPDDDYALRVENELGKTEMWHVLDCEEGAQLLFGVNRPLTKDEFKQRIEDNTLDEVCRYVPVKKGDTFFITAGTLHAIGAGILLAEVQQNSATTYRVSDYGRRGADGKLRELHIDKALDVTCLTPNEEADSAATALTDENGRVEPLASCPYFTAERWVLDGARSAGRKDTFVSLLCLEGNGELAWDGQKLPFKKGDSLFIPADTYATVSGSAELLCSYI